MNGAPQFLFEKLAEWMNQPMELNGIGWWMNEAVALPLFSSSNKNFHFSLIREKLSELNKNVL